MTTQPVLLLDQSAVVVATLDVAPERDLYRGTICLDATPRELRQLFAEFEECVEGQMFTHADEIEERVAALRLRAVFPGGSEAEVVELQVFPSTNRASFKARNRTSPPNATLDDATPIKELV